MTEARRLLIKERLARALALFHCDFENKEELILRREDFCDLLTEQTLQTHWKLVQEALESTSSMYKYKNPSAFTVRDVIRLLKLLINEAKKHQLNIDFIVWRTKKRIRGRLATLTSLLIAPRERIPFYETIFCASRLRLNQRPTQRRRRNSPEHDASLNIDALYLPRSQVTVEHS